MTRWMRAGLGALLIGCVLSASPSARADDKADNTQRNERERKADEPNADRQKNARPDLQIAAEIRRAIVKDKALSTYAKNCKVVVENGIVTLKGPVRTEEERGAVEAKAKAVVGAENVRNQLEIAPK